MNVLIGFDNQRTLFYVACDIDLSVVENVAMQRGRMEFKTGILVLNMQDMFNMMHNSNNKITNVITSFDHSINSWIYRSKLPVNQILRAGSRESTYFECFNTFNGRVLINIKGHGIIYNNGVNIKENIINEKTFGPNGNLLVRKEVKESLEFNRKLEMVDKVKQINEKLNSMLGVNGYNIVYMRDNCSINIIVDAVTKGGRRISNEDIDRIVMQNQYDADSIMSINRVVFRELNESNIKLAVELVNIKSYIVSIDKIDNKLIENNAFFRNHILGINIEDRLRPMINLSKNSTSGKIEYHYTIRFENLFAAVAADMGKKLDFEKIKDKMTVDWLLINKYNFDIGRNSWLKNIIFNSSCKYDVYSLNDIREVGEYLDNVDKSDCMMGLYGLKTKGRNFIEQPKISITGVQVSIIDTEQWKKIVEILKNDVLDGSSIKIELDKDDIYSISVEDLCCIIQKRYDLYIVDRGSLEIKGEIKPEYQSILIEYLDTRNSSKGIRVYKQIYTNNDEMSDFIKKYMLGRISISAGIEEPDRVVKTIRSTLVEKDRLVSKMVIKDAGYFGIDNFRVYGLEAVNDILKNNKCKEIEVFCKIRYLRALKIKNGREKARNVIPSDNKNNINEIEVAETSIIIDKIKQFRIDVNSRSKLIEDTLDWIEEKDIKVDSDIDRQIRCDLKKYDNGNSPSSIKEMKNRIIPGGPVVFYVEDIMNITMEFHI